MPCLNAGHHLHAAVESVLAQPECLELLVADGGSSDGSLQSLEVLAAHDRRVRLVSRADVGPADALNKAFQTARGTLIGWLNADDLYATGALARALDALEANPEWLLVYGEADHINADGDVLDAYPTKPPNAGVEAFNQGCFVCQPTVIYRRALGILLGPFSTDLETAFDFDYWLRAFTACPERIGYIPSIQAYSRLHPDTITAKQRDRVALESMQLLARTFGHAPSHWLLTLAEELLDQGATLTSEAWYSLLQQATPHIKPSEQGVVAAKMQAMKRAHEHQQNGDWGDRTARSLLHLLRPDLVAHFQSQCDPEQAYWTFLLTNGWNEYPQLQYDDQLCRDLLDRLDQHGGANLLKQLPRLPATPISTTAFLDRPFGVNLIGYVQGQLGIGEDLRCTTSALAAAGVPTALLNFPPGQEIPQNDHSLTDQIQSQGPYAFNLFCLTAEEIARYLMERSEIQLQERYNIGYSPWELSRWPGPWLPLLGLVDELWASSQHTADAMQQGLETPHHAAAQPGPTLRTLPLTVTLDLEQPLPLTTAQRQAIRHRYQLPLDSVIFTFSFDLNSSIHRKNPLLAMRAFQRAFPPEHPLAARVALLIKTHWSKRPSAEWHRLKQQAAADPRLHILETTLPRTELLSLYAACDAFLSLHRAEGFGRGLAEALLLGLDVIATDYGGNCDFCTGPLAHPVRYELIPVANSHYPHHRGQSWAQASVAHAAERMQQVAQRRLSQGPPHTELVASYMERFDPVVCGARYRQRLEELWHQRDHLAERLRWSMDGPID
jgi:glycosyltransferase involved in cell wall biosynthesis